MARYSKKDIVLKDEVKVDEDTTDKRLTSLQAVEIKPLPNIKLAKKLTGKPQIFSEEYLSDFSVLLKQGVAAYFGEEGLGV